MNPISMLALRCKSCSAPLSAAPTDDIVCCQFCGSSQKLVDARAFFDQVLLQVNAWVRQAIPVGMEAMTTGMVDPIARHTIFENNIRPRLTTEYGEYRFNCFNVLAQPMAVLPYLAERGMPLLNNPKDVFLFQAKVQQISALAVDDASKGMISEVGALSVAYGYLLNNAALMADLKPERYHFMKENFEAAAQAVKSASKFSGLLERFQGLAKLAKGLDQLTSLSVQESMSQLEDAKATLQGARATALQNLDMSLMVQGIDKELSVARSATYIAEALQYARGGEYEAVMMPIHNLMGVLASLQERPFPQWQGRFRDVNHHEEILKVVADIQKAKAGAGAINMVPVQGTVLFPFWAVDIPYTFQTGALWRTQGVEVTEALLASATFPADPDAFSGNEPRPVLTDVFSARGKSGFFNKISGKETSISGGGPVRDVINRSQPYTPGAMRVIPPLSTAQDAVVIVQDYITRARQADRTIQNQLRLSAPRVIGLIFVPGMPDNLRPNVLNWLGGLAPRSVGSIATLATIAL
jgi:hypothetical protein